MKYAVLVSSAPGLLSPGQCALRFIRAALGGGCEVTRVFFNQQGVLHGVPSNDNPAEWSAIAGHVDLVVCSTALSRENLAANQLLPGFRRGGLGLWMEACLEAERILVFGG